MKRLEHETCFAIALVLLVVSPVFAESPDEEVKTVTIPLSEIWALEMPGTKDIGELQKQLRPEDIRRLQRKSAPKEESARPAFAVQGSGFEALRNSYEVLVKKEEPQHSFDANTEISIVFFSITSIWYVHLESVVLENRTITINYKFISHEEQETTSHFALIPLGKLPVGKYQVDVVPNQVNTADEATFPSVDDEIINRIVSRSFSFTVKEGT